MGPSAATQLAKESILILRGTAAEDKSAPDVRLEGKPLSFEDDVLSAGTWTDSASGHKLACALGPALLCELISAFFDPFPVFISVIPLTGLCIIAV